MGGMETRLAGKIDQLERSVKCNKESIVILTETVNKNTIDLSRLESQFRDHEENFDTRVADIVRNISGAPGGADVSWMSRGPPPLGGPPEQVSRYWQCRWSLRLWPVQGQGRDLLQKN